MKALICSDVGHTKVGERPDPEASRGEVVIQVLAAGLCGTDRHISDGSYFATRPVVLGHEVVGRVVQVGLDVHRLRIGDRISVDPNLACESCRHCHNGNPHLCDSLVSFGVTRDGGLASYMVVPERQCYLVPDELPSSVAILAEPLSCVVHAIDRAQIRSGMSAAVWGLGTAGMLIIQYLAHIGITSITAVSHHADHRERALLHGATTAISSDQLPERPVDIAIEASGSVTAFESGLRSLRKGGTLLVYGVAAPNDQAMVRPEYLFKNEISIVGSFVGPHTMDRAIELLQSGVIQSDSVLGEVLSLDEAADWVSKRGEHRRSKVYTLF